MREMDGQGYRPAPQQADGTLQHALLDEVQDYAIFALDEEGRIASWNQGAERLTGYQSREVLGEPFTCLGDPKPRVGLVEVLRGARQSGRFAQERWWRRRDGTLIWIHELINPLQNGQDPTYVVIARDLSEQVAAQERLLAGQAREELGLSRETKLRAELQAAERRAAFLAEASSILVASAINFEGTVRSLARLAVSRLGDWCIVHALRENGDLECTEVAHRDPRKEELLARLVDGLMTPAWLDPVRSVLQTGQAQVLDSLPSLALDELRPEERSALLGESASPSAAIITPLLGRGRVLGALTLVSAESGRVLNDDDVELAEELGRRAAIALDNARLYREAQEANRAKADFLAVMSHELRTPLNAIMGYTDLIDAEVSGPLTDKQHAQIGRVRTSARHLLQLIEEILSFARMEAGGEDMKVDAATVSFIVQEAVSVIEPLAHAKGLELDVQLSEPELELRTDTTKVRQVLVNLLSNAVKFTQEGAVRVRARRRGDQLLLEVIDTGVGIPEDQQELIFDSFWQGERPNTRRVGGTGLGLSVSRRYARMLGGEIRVESMPGEGETFRVRIPIQRNAPSADS
jgi:PAS domain S-box-containing protein